MQWGLRKLKQSSAYNVKLSYQNFVSAHRLRGKWWAVKKKLSVIAKKETTARETLDRIVEEDNRAKKSEKPNHYILTH